MLSNGPGDPAEPVEVIENLKHIFELNIPTFGICLGHQLSALAAGAKTMKLKYGHRGANQPVTDFESGRTFITSQNHGYAVVGEELPAEMGEVAQVNANDGTCEGIKYKKWNCFTVQFHPEANGGPKDTEFLFDRFLNNVKAAKRRHAEMPKDPRIKKVLVIGSGPIIIGQAAEFDYSGTQACRALKAEGIETVLLNSNPATIMTDPDVADHVYIEPMTLEVVERILDIEKPDSVLPNLGGQMGLNLSMELARSGYLDRTGIRLLACKPETIDRAEDRELFKETMEKLHQPIIPSEVVETLQDALACADRIGYPVIVRPAFTMGGTGGGICENKAKLIEIGTNGLRLSPIHQILVEKCIAGWKEIEYEVMRDHKGNVITVCNMENLDPVGIHTGDSVVVAPSQTLTDHEYQMLRTAALDIITELGIEGGCNCQFALKPDSFDYAVIEVNPRVSRSSALASKATGYPIAKVATKIAIGYTLDEITNDVTGKTCACFEPALDYIVVKYPKWPFDKFVYADKSLGTQMMATGEVMSIGNSFEAAMMKAVSSIELGMDTLTHKPFEELTDDEIVAHMHVQDAERVFCVYEALKRGIDHQTIYRITKIDWWFLDKMQHLADLEKGLAKCNGVLTEEQYKTAKKYGFQDKTIKRLAQVDTLPVENYRAGFKMVDTCAAEFSANTPYFYSTYDGDNEAAEFIAEKEAEASPRASPGKRRCWSLVPAPSASVRASSSTTARCTVCGP